MSDETGEAERLAGMIADARRTVIFTGAGISTESGIPDFRSPDGVWTTMKPIEYRDLVASRTIRREAWDRVFANSAGWVGAALNAGHHAVAALVVSGRADCVVTQNVDNLHQDAGTPPDRIIELHGNASYARCLECGRRHELADLRPHWQAGAEIVCDDCGGLLKTATISFGQPLPEAELARAVEASRRADLFIVLGSSLVVNPAATLPAIAKRSGADLVIVNRDKTPLDAYADLRSHGRIGTLLSQVMERLERRAVERN